MPTQEKPFEITMEIDIDNLINMHIAEDKTLYFEEAVIKLYVLDAITLIIIKSTLTNYLSYYSFLSIVDEKN